MKKLILVFAIAMSTTCFAQKDTASKPLADTAATIHTPLLSYQDIIDALGDHPLKCAEPIRNSLVALIQQKASEYAQKNKLKPKGANK